jgi:hypothetical protein
VLHPVLQLDELALQAEELLEIGLARRLVGGAARFELIEVAVLDLELELLIVAVDQVACDALHQFFLVAEVAGKRHGRLETGKPHAAPPA